MQYLSVAEIAKKWNISGRSVRNYCAQGRVPEAFLVGKAWNIPADAKKPERANKKKEKPVTLLDILRVEKANRYDHRSCEGCSDRKIYQGITSGSQKWHQ